MNRKETIYWAALVLGILSAAAALVLDGRIPKSVGGVMLGAGVGAASMFASRLSMLRFEWKDPEFAKRSRIEAKDERNTMIRSLAKARAGDVTKWAVMAVAYVFILMDAPLWMTLLTIACFVLYQLLYFRYTLKYEREM